MRFTTYAHGVDLADDVIGALMGAGNGALTFNAPLSMGRANALISSLSDLGAESIVDLGCGRGELARLAAAQPQTTTVFGVDSDPQQIRAAQELTADRALEDRVTFVVGDAAAWTWDRAPKSSDAALCVGASHAFGGSAPMFDRLAAVVPTGTAMIGDSVWQTAPNQWCAEAFGELLSSPETLASLAADAGWTVVEVSSSSMAEWDGFEGGWITGVRSVGTKEAEAFADQREHEYKSQYRGVLGFCWLVLHR